jgi:hypothetical protein
MDMDGKQWKCKNGHVLGVVDRKKLDGLRVTVLVEFRLAIDLDAANVDEPKISGVLEGGKTIICSVCESERYFSPSNEAAERFWKRRRERAEREGLKVEG